MSASQRHTDGRNDGAPDVDVIAALDRLGVVGDVSRARFTPLAGGVSSDIWKVEGGGATVCVKRARPRLAVSATWEVPVERNHFEAEYLRVAAAETPDLAPELVAEDRDAGLIVLAYLDPARWRVWKADLLDGRVDARAGVRLGERLGRFHRATAGRDDLARRFSTDGLFHALRLEPYLLEAARRHPALADRLGRLVATTASTRAALVHGDVSPKNILVDADGDIRLLDAECAWYGDPAFDVAFPLNHFVLKMIHRPDAAKSLRAAVNGFLAAYAGAFPAAIDHGVLARAARLLPGLMLARVDGKSPVEYLTNEPRRDHVRALAARFLTEMPARPETVADAVLREVSP